MVRHASILAILACAVLARSAPAASQSSAFVFNGHLAGVTDIVDVRFTLWDSASGGAQVGPTLRFDGSDSNRPPISVSASNYGASLNFGPDAFSTGGARWLKVEYRVPHDPTGTQPYAEIAPRQQIGQTVLATMSKNTRGLTVDSNNRVNIGSGAPSELLQLDGGNLWLNGENAGLIVGAGSKSSGLMKYAFREAGFWRGAGTAFSIGRVNTNDVTTGTPLATPDFFISGTGNVGIGTANPGNPLTVAGAIGTTGGLIFPDGTSQTTAVQASSISPPSNGTAVVDTIQQITPANSSVQMSYVWQSFRCTKTGRLTHIGVKPTQNIAADIPITLNVYDGPTPGSPLLGSYSLTIKAGSSSNYRLLVIPVETAPQVYAGRDCTLEFSSQVGWMGDAQTRNPYPAGQCNGSSDLDLWFGTLVTQGVTKGLVTIGGDLKFSSFKGVNAVSTCQLTSSHNLTSFIYPSSNPDWEMPKLADSYTNYALPRGLAVVTWSLSCWSQVPGLKVRAAPYLLRTTGLQTGPSVLLYITNTFKHMTMSGSAVFDIQDADNYEIGMKLGSDDRYMMVDGNDFVSWTVTVYRY